MAELNKKLNIEKGGIKEEIPIYTTLAEVNNRGIEVMADNRTAYIPYGSTSDPNASMLNCQLPNDYNNYKVLKKGSTPTPVGDKVILQTFNVETDQQISVLEYPIKVGETLYLNNDNAPRIEGYDFVMMDGVRNKVENAGQVFKVWYISNGVPDRNKTSWRLGDNVLVETLNTYSLTDAYQMFYNSYMTEEVKRMNFSNVTTMRQMFYYTNIKVVAELDTSKVTDFNYAFCQCSKLQEIPWTFDFSSCQSCSKMFTGTPIAKVRLRNVPSYLDLSNIGVPESKLWVYNYI